MQAIKLLVRWLLGMKNNQSKSANSTLRLLSAMLVSEGDLTEQKKIRWRVKMLLKDNWDTLLCNKKILSNKEKKYCGGTSTISFPSIPAHPSAPFLCVCSKSDMSRLRLAAGGAIMKLAQEPCYHDIITPEQFQLCGLVINVSSTFIPSCLS